jgi:quercetin dioxygenase-like cupin family protein
MNLKVTGLLLLLLLGACVEAGMPQAAPSGSVQLVLSQPLPKMDGNHLSIQLYEVNYPPDKGSGVHTHPCAVVGYVVEGTIVSQVKGQPETAYPAGKTFYEAPNGVHEVSKNGGTTPAKLLAIFLCDHDGPLSVPLPHPAGQAGSGPPQSR